jgi:Na+/H+ antiporter NhaD/arsenite permease-like protein
MLIIVRCITARNSLSILRRDASPPLIFSARSYLLTACPSFRPDDLPKMPPKVTQLPKYQPLLVTIGMLTAAYLLSLAFGLPQAATQVIASAESPAPVVAAATASIEAPPLWMTAPFGALLLAIAVLPLVPALAHWWDSNLHKFYVAGGLAALTLTYYLFLHNSAVYGQWPARAIWPHSDTGLNYLSTWAVFGNAILTAFIPFIVLLLSLYTISGGIRLTGDLRAHPATNTGFLAIGALLASVIGTTGAAMLLIRPLLETNRERRHVSHTIVFFVFVVCNCGGLLLPTGDPPLFLGYLMKVPFLWTLGLWKPWLLVNASLLVIYFVWDSLWAYPREGLPDIARDETQTQPLRIAGAWPNALLLVAVIVAVGLLDPGKPFPGTGWHPWLYLRELVQLGLVALSLALGDRRAREANGFNFGAIIEVAVLFFGIFICMQPPLQVLAHPRSHPRLVEPWQYFWASGGLSSVLDNAPTYVVFFEAAKSVSESMHLSPTVAETGVYVAFLIALSLGSVMMGANTYIGNGPNFMVKTIAEKSGVKMPSFFGYMVYSGLILIPLFVAVTYVFLR